MKTLRKITTAATTVALLTLPADRLEACNAKNHQTMAAVAPLQKTSEDGSEQLRVQGRASAAELRAASGGSLAALWRANREQFLSAPAGTHSSLRFRVPSAATPVTSKSFQAPGMASAGTQTKAFDLGGILQVVMGILGALLQSSGGMTARAPFPSAPGVTPNIPASLLAGLGQSNTSRNPGGVFGTPNQSFPGQSLRPPGQNQNLAGQNQSTVTPGALNAPEPRTQSGLRDGWISNDPTSGHPRITRGFGRKFHPIQKRMKGHTGIDISKSRGSGPTAIAVGPASVIFAGRKGGYGNTIILKHAGGNQTLYAHLASFSVSKNTSIPGGTKVGMIGSTGNSTGPHLHFEVIQGGSKVNPKPYFPSYPYAD